MTFHLSSALLSFLVFCKFSSELTFWEFPLDSGRVWQQFSQDKSTNSILTGYKFSILSCIEIICKKLTKLTKPRTSTTLYAPVTILRGFSMVLLTGYTTMLLTATLHNDASHSNTTQWCFSQQHYTTMLLTATLHNDASHSNDASHRLQSEADSVLQCVAVRQIVAVCCSEADSCSVLQWGR